MGEREEEKVKWKKNIYIYIRMIVTFQFLLMVLQIPPPKTLNVNQCVHGHPINVPQRRKWQHLCWTLWALCIPGSLWPLLSMASSPNLMQKFESQGDGGLRRQPDFLHIPLSLVITSSNALQRLEEWELPKNWAPDTFERTRSSWDAFPGKQLTFVIPTLSYIYLFTCVEFSIKNSRNLTCNEGGCFTIVIFRAQQRATG